MDNEKWDTYLFDDSFQRSRLYFTVLETLRVGRVWVTEMVEDWDRLHKQWTREVRPGEIFDEADWRAAEDGWDAVGQMLQAKAKLLRDRIDRKSDEVKGLRDGVRFSHSIAPWCLTLISSYSTQHRFARRQRESS